MTTHDDSPVQDPEPGASADVRPGARRIRTGVGAFLILATLGALFAWYQHAQGFEDTDDAQVDGHLVPVTSRIDGTIQSVRVDDNHVVKLGDLLVELEPQDNKVAVQQATAQLDQAKAQLIATTPSLPIARISNESTLASGSADVTAAIATLAAARQDLAVAEARLKEAQARGERAQADFVRYQTLLDKQEVSRADYDQFRATATAQTQVIAQDEAAVESAKQIVQQRQAQLEQQQSKLQESRSSAPLRIAIRQADIKTQQASAEMASAALEKAKLALGYGTIVAPLNGVITQRSAEVGARVTSGQQLMMIVETDDLWVTANFKETQLTKVHPGERVRIYVDALKETFDGTVESMAAITGSRTSVLPPENATGNYVKVIQRMPIRIRFNPGQRDLDKLRPGMSVEPKITLE